MPKKYDRQIILSLHSQNYPLVTALIEKWNHSQSGACHVVYLNADTAFNVENLSTTDKALMSQLSGKSRLYIVGHGSEGFPAIFGDQQNKIISAKALASLISSTVNHNNIAGLRISLLTCNGAQSSSNGNDTSLGSTFHKFLKDQGINEVELVARNNSLLFAKNPFNGSSIKLSLGEHEALLFLLLKLQQRKLYESLQSTAIDSSKWAAVSFASSLLAALNSLCSFSQPLSKADTSGGFATKSPASCAQLFHMHSTRSLAILLKIIPLMAPWALQACVAAMLSIFSLPLILKGSFVRIFLNSAFDHFSKNAKLLNRSRTNAKTLYLWENDRQIKRSAYHTNAEINNTAQSDETQDAIKRPTPM